MFRDDKIKENEDGHVARIWAVRNAYRILFENSEVHGTCERNERRWEDNIKIDNNETNSLREFLHWPRMRS
jgi:hypothetical protein